MATKLERDLEQLSLRVAQAASTIALISDAVPDVPDVHNSLAMVHDCLRGCAGDLSQLAVAQGAQS